MRLPMASWSVLPYGGLDFTGASVIGRGRSGPVRVVRRIDTGRSVAIKCLWDGKKDSIPNPREKTRARNILLEARTMMRDTQHPHVLPMVGLASSPTSGATFLLTEYATRGSLADGIRRKLSQKRRVETAASAAEPLPESALGTEVR